MIETPPISVKKCRISEAKNAQVPKQPGVPPLPAGSRGGSQEVPLPLQGPLYSLLSREEGGARQRSRRETLQGLRRALGIRTRHISVV